MKRFLLFAIALILLTVHCHAQGKDVTDPGVQEIQRLGNHVELTGTVRTGLISQALAHPADDSHKWFITLVINAIDPACTAMRDTIAKDPAMKAWVDVDTPAHSATHYQVRRIDDPTQKDWLKPIRESIDQHGLPCIVLQPPTNGQFGKPSTIVKIIHGKMSGIDLSNKLREVIIAYVQTMSAEPAKAGTVAQNDPAGAVAPPFNLPQNNPGPNPNLQNAPAVPFEYPPSAPAVLTIDQIKAACPGATPEFVLDAIESKVTSIEIVKLKWEVAQAKKACDKPADPPDKPSTPFVAVDDHPDKTEPKSEPVPSNFCLPACPTPSSTEMLVIVGLVAFLSGILMLGLAIVIAAKIGDLIKRKRNPTASTNDLPMAENRPSNTRPLTSDQIIARRVNELLSTSTATPNGNANAMPPVPNVTLNANGG